MKKILGYIQGNMKMETIETTDEDAEVINSLLNPPLVSVKKEDIYVRRCRLASDAIDYSYGKFRTEDLPRLLEFAQGVSLLIGHRKDTAGVARFFDGSIEQIDDVYNPFTQKKERITYIVPKFYWMKKHSRAEDLRINIDGGIYHQVSLSWWYKKAACGICGKDMRDCEHIPGRKYNNILAFYYYDRIGDVLEGSIVYKGGQPYTGFYLNNELSEGLEECRKIYSGFSSDKCDGNIRIFREDIVNYLKPLKGCAYIAGDIADKGYSDDRIDIIVETANRDEILDLLPLPFKNVVDFVEPSTKGSKMIKMEGRTSDDSSEFRGIKGIIKNENINNEYFSKKDFIRFTGKYVIEPLYEGILVQVHKDEKSVKIFDTFGKEISNKLPDIIEDVRNFNEKNLILDGVLLVYHGRTRFGHKDVCDIVYNNKNLEGLRLRLKVFDFLRCGNLDSTDMIFKTRREILPEIFYDTKNVQIVKAQFVGSPSEIIANIEKYSTKNGAIIKDTFSKYYEKDKWFKYKKMYEIDAKIIDYKVAEEGTEYLCGVISTNELKAIGNVFSKRIGADKGDIVRIEVENAELEDDEIKLHSPKIIEIRYDKKYPDNVNVIKRISETERDSVNSDSMCEFMVYEYNEENVPYFELLVQNNSEAGFVKFKRKGDFLFNRNGMSLTECRESLGCIPSDSKILDYGYVFDFKDSKHFKKFSLFGRFGQVKGNFIARGIVYQGRNLFLLWKVDF